MSCGNKPLVCSFYCLLFPFLYFLCCYKKIYFTGLSDNLSSNVKLFTNDTSLFSLIHDVSVSTGELNEDLRKINGEWKMENYFQWKTIFNPDTTKQAQEARCSQKIKKPLILLLFSTVRLCLKLTDKST